MSDPDPSYGCPACDGGRYTPCSTCGDAGVVTRTQRDAFHDKRRRGTRDLVDRARRDAPALDADTLVDMLATLDARVTALEALHKDYEPEPGPALQTSVVSFSAVDYGVARVVCGEQHLSEIEHALREHNVTLRFGPKTFGEITVDGVALRLDPQRDHDLVGLLTLALAHIGWRK